ncbi:MAG: carboxylesterase family protein, partial [Planctomycetota bacterium]
MRKRCLVSLVLIVVGLGGCAGFRQRLELSPRMRQGTFEFRIADQPNVSTESCRYLVVLPKGYGKKGQVWPLIMYLHSAGKRPEDLNKIWIPMPPRVREIKKDFSFIVLYPQCPKDTAGKYTGWPTELLMALLDDMESTYRVDSERVYLTGISMGASGTWSLACEYPDRFAAVAPVCGLTRPSKACRLKNVPIWAFHGAKDNVIPLKESEEMVEAVN